MIYVSYIPRYLGNVVNVEDLMPLIDEKTAPIELTEAELDEVAGGFYNTFNVTINNQDSNQGLQIGAVGTIYF